MTTDPLGERIAKLEAVLPRIDQNLDELRRLMEKRLREQNERISALERWRAGLVAVGAVFGAIASVAGKAILDWLKGQ